MARRIEGTRYLIVGNSAGGIGAAEAIRASDPSGRILILSEEPYLAYSRPLISDYLSGHRTYAGMLFRDHAFYREQRVETLLGTRVVRLDPSSRQVELDNGDRIEWEKLLLATGGTPITPPMAGSEKKNVFNFTTLDDAKAVKAAVPPGATAVVIGGGLIGLGVSQALVRRGVKVVLVELMDRVLGAALDRGASRIVEKTLRGAGITLITGHTVVEIVGTAGDESLAGGVVLDDGRRIDCRAVIVAIGVRPRVDMAADAGIAVGRGIVVDGGMSTSCPDVHACGDAAEVHDPVRNETRPNPIWPNAYKGGRIAGLNMARGPSAPAVEYSDAIGFNAFNYFGMAAVSAGIVDPPSGNGYRALRSPANNGAYRRVVLDGNRIAGMVFVGDIRNSGIVFGLMRDRVDVRAFQGALVSDEFGLASLPASLRHNMLNRREVTGFTAGMERTA